MISEQLEKRVPEDMGIRTSLGMVVAGVLALGTAVGLGATIGLKASYNAARKDAADVSVADREIADWTFGMLITSILTTGASVGGLYWVAQSLGASRRANELSAQSVATSERAWVFTTPRATGPIRWTQDDGWEVSIVMENRNLGKTAALLVHTNVRSAVFGSHKAKLAEMIKDPDDELAGHVGMMLGPGEMFQREWGLTSDRDPPSPNEVVLPGHDVLIGVIKYRTIFGQQRHYTAFVYQIQKTEDLVTFSPWAGGSAT